MLAYMMDWLELVVRWIHVITGVSWIGASFYFNWLNNSLRPPETPAEGVDGEVWAVHGGHFYRVNKYACLLYTSPSPRDATLSRMPSSA